MKAKLYTNLGVLIHELDLSNEVAANTPPDVLRWYDLVHDAMRVFVLVEPGSYREARWFLDLC